MQTIDIAQAIKENSTNVSQNLDSSVLEGLLPEATSETKGLMPVAVSKFAFGNLIPNCQRNKFYKAFRLQQYALGVLVLLYGSITIKNGLQTVIFSLNNRCQGTFYIQKSKIISTDSSQYTIYGKYNSDNSVDFYFKGHDESYVILNYFWLIRPESYKLTVYNVEDNSVTESNLNAITL